MFGFPSGSTQDAAKRKEPFALTEWRATISFIAKRSGRPGRLMELRLSLTGLGLAREVDATRSSGKR